MKRNFLTVARLLYDKGYSELVAASKIIKPRYRDVMFHWVGGMDEGYPEFVTPKQIILDQDAGYLRYHGYTRDVKEYMQKADCIILPSYHEGMSRTLMESLAMGKPVITSDIPGCREAVEEGKNGFLCRPKDTDSLVAAIEKFLSLSELQIEEMGRFSRRKAEMEFDVEKVIEFYDKILGEQFGDLYKKN